MSFESLTDGKIQDLLKMRKAVTNANSKAKKKDAHTQLNYHVSGADGYEFQLYCRQNDMPGMEDDFSCGLSWIASNGELLTLVRYNGASHDHPNHLEKERLGYNCHIHKATEKYIKAGKKAEGFAEVTNRYTTLKGAIHCLVTDCLISGLTTEPDMPKLF